MVFDLEYCVSGAASYDGRVYIPLNAVTDKENASSETNTGKTLVIHSFAVDDRSFVRSSEKVWTSSTVNGGTQSIPVESPSIHLRRRQHHGFRRTVHRHRYRG